MSARLSPLVALVRDYFRAYPVPVVKVMTA
jgi:hypothetical protein